MRISRWTGSTARRPPHSVSGSSLPLALRLASSREAASSFSSGDRLTGVPSSGCWISASAACASSTSRLLPRTGGASGRASPRSRRGGRTGYLQLMLPRCRLLLRRLGRRGFAVGWLARRGSAASRPLVDDPRVGVAGGRADAERGAVAAGAFQHRRLGWAARSGPPNRASIAWVWASCADMPTVPATGGVSE